MRTQREPVYLSDYSLTIPQDLGMFVEGNTERKIWGVYSNVLAEAGLQKREREKWESAHTCE